MFAAQRRGLMQVLLPAGAEQQFEGARKGGAAGRQDRSRYEVRLPAERPRRQHAAGRGHAERNFFHDPPVRPDLAIRVPPRASTGAPFPPLSPPDTPHSRPAIAAPPTMPTIPISVRHSDRLCSFVVSGENRWAVASRSDGAALAAAPSRADVETPTGSSGRFTPAGARASTASGAGIIETNRRSVRLAPTASARLAPT